MTTQSNVEFRIVNTEAGTVFSERFLTQADAWDRIWEFRELSLDIRFLTVFTMSAPEFHWLADKSQECQQQEGPDTEEPYDGIMWGDD